MVKKNFKDQVNHLDILLGEGWNLIEQKRRSNMNNVKLSSNLELIQRRNANCDVIFAGITHL